MELIPIVFNAPEANDVFIEVKSAGVKIVLEDVTTALTIIEKFLQQYKQCFWSLMTLEISSAIKRELRKSRNVIDVDLIGQFVDYLESTVEEGQEEEEEEENKEEKAEDSDEEEGGSDEEEFTSEEDVEDSDGSESEEIVDSDEEWDEDSDDDVAEGKKEVVISSEEIEKFKDPATRERCKYDLLLVCREMGLMVKPGQEEEILDKMYPYIRGGRPYRRSIRFFMKRVRERMDRSSTLDDLKTVEAALKSSIFDDVYGGYKIVKNPSTIMEEDMADAKDPVNQQLKKNMVPTQEEEEEEEEEEGTASPMNQIKPEEKRECGDIMEIEEMETMAPLTLAEQAKESTGNGYSSCIKESLERGGANKRKLAQI